VLCPICITRRISKHKLLVFHFHAFIPEFKELPILLPIHYQVCLRYCSLVKKLESKNPIGDDKQSLFTIHPATFELDVGDCVSSKQNEISHHETLDHCFNERIGCLLLQQIINDVENESFWEKFKQRKTTSMINFFLMISRESSPAKRTKEKRGILRDE